MGPYYGNTIVEGIVSFGYGYSITKLANVEVVNHMSGAAVHLRTSTTVDVRNRHKNTLVIVATEDYPIRLYLA